MNKQLDALVSKAPAELTDAEIHLMMDHMKEDPHFFFHYIRTQKSIENGNNEQLSSHPSKEL